jgi:hypothetical protein
MPSHILVNSLGLTYKSTIGVSTATLPDVCKTPSPGGPVPIPYPNFANQGSLDKGTKTVKAKGNMIAIKGSEYSMSFGDEPGTVGGVTSNTFKKETSWITYSFDVKMDGENACRHTDKKFHNHKNTVDLAGNIDPLAGVRAMTDFVCGCHQLAPKPGENCRQLGERKHKCVNDAIKNHNDQGGEPKLQGEKGYNEKTGAEVPGASRDWKPGMTPEAYFKGIAGKIFPDGAILDANGKVERFCEFKFQCPAGVPTRRKKKGSPEMAAPSTGTAVPDWTPARRGKNSQLKRTEDLGAAQEPPVTKDPELIRAPQDSP